MAKMKKFSKRRMLAAALVYGAAFASAFIVSPAKIVPRTTSTAANRNGNHATNLSLWKKVETEADTSSTLVDESTPWFFPRDVKRPAEESTGGQGRLGLIMMQTQEILSPAATALDEVTDGWALSYADLSPESENTPVGQAFLATNIAYALVGVLLSLNGEGLLGFLTECASVASFIYHYTQLQASTKRVEDSTVRLALMVDYIFAVSSILLATFYLVADHQLPPMEGIVSGGIGLGCLFACWVWERGLPYIVLHSLWHLFSAYCGYVVGNAHIGA